MPTDLLPLATDCRRCRHLRLLRTRAEQQQGNSAGWYFCFFNCDPNTLTLIECQHFAPREADHE